MTGRAHAKQPSRWRPVAIGVIAAIATAVVLAPHARKASAGSLAGSAGTDTALPATDSVVTVSGRGPFANLQLTVNQTKGLVNQAVSVTWTGGAPSLYASTPPLSGNYLQIFQCWGDDDGTNPANPGPPPEKCQFGGLEAKRVLNVPVPAGHVYSRILSTQGSPNYDPSQGYVDNSSGVPVVWRRFEAVDGKSIDAELNFKFNPFIPTSGPYWLDPYFNYYTTNEDDFATTSPTGTGSELFNVDTGLEAPGLGCGQQVEALPGGSLRRPKCWLVIVPRGTPAQENPAGTGLSGVYLSPLDPSAWKNRIAVPLEFNPVDAQCAIGADERRIVGSEMATAAVTNWQPTLCATPGAPPFSYASLSDSQARRQLVSTASGAPGMAVVSRPLDPATVDPSNPVVYAPLTLSAITIGFDIERMPGIVGAQQEPTELPLQGIRVAHINLTPRLVAKLLTQSYQSQFLGLNVGGKVPAGYDKWYPTNPPDLGSDQEFLKYNPEFKILRVGSSKGASGLVVELPTSDAAHELWRWVLADPEASAWLAGAPDPWGMKVNAVYNTAAALNSSGAAFGNPIPENFPKNDPFCTQAQKIPQYPDPIRGLCMLDNTPYANNLLVAAQETRAANDGAKTTGDDQQLSAANYWTADGPQLAGSRFLGSVTDSASAARYGLQTANLSRAGDDTDGRSFIAPDQGGILAGQQAMIPGSDPAVLEPNPSTSATGAYPLTMLTYAAVTPRSLSTAARGDYANFITYASGPGQVSGLKFGQLPPGYAPLPSDLRAQAAAAATAVRTGAPPPPTQSPGAPAAAVTPGDTGTATTTAGSSVPPNPSTPVVGVGSPGGAALVAQSPVATQRANPTASPQLAGAVARSPGSIGSTPRQGLGAIRFTLPIALLVGMLAGLGARILGRQNRAGASGLTALVSGVGRAVPHHRQKMKT